MRNRPTSLQVLREARRLLDERGWIAESRGESDWFGDQPGPLTVTRALWHASRWGDKPYVAPDAAGQAAKTLCLVLWPGKLRGSEDWGFVELGFWCRKAGRTPEEVFALFDRAIAASERAVADFAARLEALLAEDESEAAHA